MPIHASLCTSALHNALAHTRHRKQACIHELHDCRLKYTHFAQCQTIIMARFLQLVKLLHDNSWRIKEIKESEEKEKEGIKRQCKSTAHSQILGQTK